MERLHSHTFARFLYTIRSDRTANVLALRRVGSFHVLEFQAVGWGRSYLTGPFKAGLHFLILGEVSSSPAGRKGVWGLSWRLGGLEMVLAHNTQPSQLPFNTVCVQDEL